MLPNYLMFFFGLIILCLLGIAYLNGYLPDWEDKDEFHG